MSWYDREVKFWRLQELDELNDIPQPEDEAADSGWNLVSRVVLGVSTFKSNEYSPVQ